MMGDPKENSFQVWAMFSITSRCLIITHNLNCVTSGLMLLVLDDIQISLTGKYCTACFSRQKHHTEHV